MHGATGRRRERPLTRERVVSAALRLADRRGLAALSMRRLGAVLGVEAMSLYKHVPSKPALLELLVERVLAGAAPPPPDAAWEGRVRHFADEMRRLALAHPQLFPLVATRMPASGPALAPLEVLLGALVDAGLDDDSAVRHFWTIVAWATGALLAETAATTGAGATEVELAPDLDTAAFPHLARLREAIGACDFAREYAHGLDVLLAAVRAAATSVRVRSGGPSFSSVVLDAPPDPPLVSAERPAVLRVAGGADSQVTRSRRGRAPRRHPRA